MESNAVQGSYWETEAPETVVTSGNVFRWYRRAGRLQVCLPGYRRRNGCAAEAGKLVGIKADTLTPEARELIRRALEIS